MVWVLNNAELQACFPSIMHLSTCQDPSNDTLFCVTHVRDLELPVQVNLKEQGQLRCQDEFIVWCGRRKYLRHVFLFEDLILFSKTKKIEGAYDFYIYKQSFKVTFFWLQIGCNKKYRFYFQPYIPSASLI